MKTRSKLPKLRNKKLLLDQRKERGQEKRRKRMIMMMLMNKSWCYYYRNWNYFLKSYCFITFGGREIKEK
jgi:hypothetical protein